jgi:hypothetical protein
MITPKVEDEKYFYNLPDSVLKWSAAGKFNDDTIDVYDNIFEKKDHPEYGVLYREQILRLYKKKYNMILIVDDISKTLVFDTKFDVKVHELSLSTSNLSGIKSLPKELFVLYVQGSADFLNLTNSVIPKGIVSMTFLWSAFPFNGRNLKSFRKLKVLKSSRGVVQFPKFPKNIEYIDFPNATIETFFPKSLNGFKLSDHPKLKYFNVKGCGIPRKDIPQEWKDAKKLKNIKIFY